MIADLPSKNERLERLTQNGGVIDRFADAIDADGQERCQTAVAMLHALKQFACSMGDFFQNEFASEFQHENVTEESVFSLLSEQIGFDLDTIVRAYYQRRILACVAVANGSSAPIIRDAQDADELAYSILVATMQGGMGLRAATAFTYFQKSLQIRLIPYARVALVGVPFSALNNPTDWFALAHEIGHYVYRNSIVDPHPNPLRTLQTAMSGAWSMPWLEEIVADVFGCIIAGPGIAASMQDLARQNRRVQLADSDGRHPAPVLRPYIYIDTLDRLARLWGADFSALIRDLTAQWETFLTSPWLAATYIRLPGAANPVPMSIKEARARVQEDILAQLIPLPGDPKKPASEGLVPLAQWLAPGTAGDDYLFRKVWGAPADWGTMTAPFQGPAVTGATMFTGASAPPELMLEKHGGIAVTPPTIGPANAPEVNREAIDPGKTNTKFDGQKDRFSNPGDADPKPPFRESQWVELLEFGGWIEQGPVGGTAH